MHFAEHRLAKAPDGVHHFAGVAGVGFADRNQNQVVENAFGRHADVADLGQLQAHQRQKNALDGLAHVEILHRRRAHDRGRVDADSCAAVMHCDVEHRIVVFQRIKAGVIAKRAFAPQVRPARRSLPERSRHWRELRDPRSRTSPSQPACRAEIRRSSFHRDPAAAAESPSTSWPGRRRSPLRRPCVACFPSLTQTRDNVRRPACGFASASRWFARRTPAGGNIRNCACRCRDCFENTMGSVMKRPASSGQHLRIGYSAERKIVAADHILAWAAGNDFRKERATSASLGSILSLPSKPSGFAFPDIPDMRRATSSTIPTSSAISIRRALAKAIDQHRHADPLGFSNNRAGPPVFTARSANSVISRCGSTSKGMRFSSLVLFERGNELAQVAIGHGSLKCPGFTMMEFTRHDKSRPLSSPAQAGGSDAHAPLRWRTREQAVVLAARDTGAAGRTRGPAPCRRDAKRLWSPSTWRSANPLRKRSAKRPRISGRIEILVNNAGITKDGLAMRMKQEDWDSVSPPT